MDARSPVLALAGGLVFTGGLVARLDDGGAFQWLAYVRGAGAVRVPRREADDFLAQLLMVEGLPPLDLPEELRLEKVDVQPRPCFRIEAPRHEGVSRLTGVLSFDYGGEPVPDGSPAGAIVDLGTRRFVRRDAAAEEAARAVLQELGLPRPWASSYGQPAWLVKRPQVPTLARALFERGWTVEAEGKLFRQPGKYRISVSSGVDWFDLHAEVDFGDVSAKLPELLRALRRGDGIVALSDGTMGMLPEEWLRRFAPLSMLGEAGGDRIRFRRAQAGLLDALLASQPEVQCDETFARVRDELRSFDGVKAETQPKGFVGTLRDYQREGLGWMAFLRRFGLGGCLADDMGVGKTAQVLALLESRRAERRGRAADGPARPSLVVVPRSLVFNWKEEAARFTPKLRVLDHTGLGRDLGRFAGHDVVLTTYGTLRRDAPSFRDVEFDYVVLDEAQAIKNAATDAAKAVRLLRGAHRLALSGTPVENHLGELWSLFEFLNPGMLGSAHVFKGAVGSTRSPDEAMRRFLAQALRPFILRRTKQQVAKELPAKTEQTIHCELKPEQRRLYDELRDHYRAALLKRVDDEGLQKSKMHVLEALLRLRQAACHPGLIDRKRGGQPSAKLETLLAQLEEVVSEGHGVLVFSQFTSLLAFVRAGLDERGITYEYLDGKTRDRQARVERFQKDDSCRVFLISLKAGGLGLNLTAAEYVFLLDPWWNPAVESQAIDRAHRIGQSKPVFAYRLIARDTVEERVLELQRTKKDLADAIIGEDKSLIRDLRREDLELLLS